MKMNTIIALIMMMMIVVVVDGGGIEVSFGKRVLVIVHPHLENTFTNPNFIAKLFHQTFVTFLHLPTQLVRE